MTDGNPRCEVLLPRLPLGCKLAQTPGSSPAQATEWKVYRHEFCQSAEHSAKGSEVLPHTLPRECSAGACLASAAHVPLSPSDACPRDAERILSGAERLRKCI